MLSPSIIEGQTVVVTADKATIKKDQTNTIRNISAAEIEVLPVQSVGEVVQMQAGVVGNNFRGGRSGEVSYMIDGIPVNNAFGGTGQSVYIETDAVEDLEVIVGTFNAEYGNAMSGVINMVTKDGGKQFHGKVFSAYSNYFTSHDDVFPGLMKDGWLSRNMSQDYRIVLEGPLFLDNLTFFTNYRYPAEWHTESTGDGKYVSMEKNKSHNFTGKLTWLPLKNLKAIGMFTINDWQGRGYNHYYKYNPDPIRTSYSTTYMGALTINHALSKAVFHELKFSYVAKEQTNYLYENPTDSRYLHRVVRHGVVSRLTMITMLRLNGIFTGRQAIPIV